MAMAWMSIKQYAIIKGAADEGDAKAKEVLDAQMSGASQDELNKKMDEFFGSSTGSKASSKYEEKHPSWSHPLANGLMSDEQGNLVNATANGEEEGYGDDDYKLRLSGELSEGNKVAWNDDGRYGGLKPLNQEEIDHMLDEFFSDTGNENLKPSNIKRAKLSDNVYNHLVDASNNSVMESYWNDSADNLRNAWTSGASQEEVDKLVNDFIDAEVKRTGFAYGMEKIQKK